MINLETVFMYFGIICFAAMFIILFWQVIRLNKFKNNVEERIKDIYHEHDNFAREWVVNDMNRHLDRLDEAVWLLKKEIHPDEKYPTGDVQCPKE